jgi:DNA primase
MAWQLDAQAFAIFEKHCTKIKHTRGNQYIARCPFDGHEDKISSFSFTTENGSGRYHCHGCGEQGNIITFCKAFGEDFTPFIDKNFKNGKISSPVAQISPKIDDKQTVDTVMLRIKAEEYSNSLGIEDSFLQYNLIGKDENGRFTFPYFNDDGAVIAIKHHKGKNGEPPYWHIEGNPDNSLKWYNSWNLKAYKVHRRLIIAEGEPDTIKLCRNGFQAICSSAGTNSVPELITIMKEWI